MGKELALLAKTIRDAELLKHLKPVAVKNEIEKEYELSKGELTVRCSRYSNKIRDLGSNQVKALRVYFVLLSYRFWKTIEVRYSTPSGPQVKSTKQLKSVRGRTAILTVPGPSKARNMTIFTQGREDPTQAEALRTDVLVQVIQNVNTFLTLPFVKDIWLPQSAKLPAGSIFDRPVPVAEGQKLNGSQTAAVEAILSNKPSKRLILIQGPPGTGKTTVIAAAVVSLTKSSDTERSAWLIAQSNVAVKNIAEKLADVGFFDFKLLVSKDFHFDWFVTA